MLYTRSPSWRLAELTVRLMPLPSAPLMTPRTECACHFVAIIISASVAPFLLWSKPRTVAFLLPSRAAAGFGAACLRPLADFAGDFVAPIAFPVGLAPCLAY